MPHPACEPTFLPLTMAAAGDTTSVFGRKARAANRAAADCWAALLGGCGSSGHRALITTLRDLSETTSRYAAAVHRRRVLAAQVRIDEAVREGDGAEFAEAFVGYDQAVATAVVSRLRSTTA